MTWASAFSSLSAAGAGTAGFRGTGGLAAASANGSGGLSAAQWLAVFGVALVLFAGYLICAAIWPYGPCLACIGHAGKKAGSSSRRWGRCKRCKGSGERIRWGYKLVRALRGGE